MWPISPISPKKLNTPLFLVSRSALNLALYTSFFLFCYHLLLENFSREGEGGPPLSRSVA